MSRLPAVEDAAVDRNCPGTLHAPQPERCSGCGAFDIYASADRLSLPVTEGM